MPKSRPNLAVSVICSTRFADMCRRDTSLTMIRGAFLPTLQIAAVTIRMEKDSGIWELPQLEHYTISKIGCWVALDRAIKLSDSGQIPAQHAERWRSEARDVKRWVESNCWSVDKQSYTLYAGTDDLDASVLLAGRTGFDRGARLESTIAAVTTELGRGPLLYRYTGMDREEGAFLACTFWMVNALVHIGRIDPAAELMDMGVRLSNELGLFSEQIDPTTNEFLGNMPQGLSHLALINAAHVLDEAVRSCRTGQDSGPSLGMAGN